MLLLKTRINMVAEFNRSAFYDVLKLFIGEVDYLFAFYSPT